VRHGRMGVFCLDAGDWLQGEGEEVKQSKSKRRQSKAKHSKIKPQGESMTLKSRWPTTPKRWCVVNPRPSRRRAAGGGA
jgi:hypothetical protein